MLGAVAIAPNKQRKSWPSAFEPLDEIDREILQALQREARLRLTDLSRQIGLSAPAVADRLRKLEERGVVSYRAEVNPRALGYAISAIVRISPQSRNLHIIPQLAHDIPEVTECYRITGEDCYFMRVYLRSVDELEGILDHFTPHGRTTTSIVHSAPIPPRPLPIK
jgi:Lrp/AsnC family transcriptional regulator, leucine-responsive regulatory protein